MSPTKDCGISTEYKKPSTTWWVRPHQVCALFFDAFHWRKHPPRYFIEVSHGRLLLHGECNLASMEVAKSGDHEYGRYHKKPDKKSSFCFMNPPTAPSRGHGVILQSSSTHVCWRAREGQASRSFPLTTQMHHRVHCKGVWIALEGRTSAVPKHQMRASQHP